MNELELENTAMDLLARLRRAKKCIATAESCTGGWIAKTLTDIPGSSAVFAYGIVSYSNGAKESLLGVQPGTLAAHGAVSEPVVREMAEGALRLSGADLSIAVSGIAGPEGGSDEKPVGTVWLAWALREDSGIEVFAERHDFGGDRRAVRAASVAAALAGAIERTAQYG